MSKGVRFVSSSIEMPLKIFSEMVCIEERYGILKCVHRLNKPEPKQFWKLSSKSTSAP
jgi:hypothetical protein